MNARPLQLFIGADNQIWAADGNENVAYVLTPASGRSQKFPPPPTGGPVLVSEAPLDGNEYSRQNGAWVQMPVPGAWLPVAVDGAWTGTMECRMGSEQGVLQIYGAPSLRSGKLPLSTWTLVGTLPNTAWPPATKAFLAPAELTSNAPDYCYARVDPDGTISVMPSSNNVNQVLVDVTMTLR